MKDRPPPPKVPSLNRHARRAGKRERLKLLQGGKRPDAPTLDTSTPAGRFAVSLHAFLANYAAAHPEAPESDLCAAALHVAAKFAVEIKDSNADDFGKAASSFFVGECVARRGPVPS